MFFSFQKSNQNISVRQRFLSVQTLSSFFIALIFIYFLTTQFDIDWGKNWVNLRGMDFGAYIFATLVYYLSFLFRGLRWRILVLSAGIPERYSGELPSLWKFSQLILIGWFVNSIAWLRLGDAYRAYALSEDSDKKFSWSLGTVLAERMFDTATVLILMVLGIGMLSGAIESNNISYLAIGAVILVLILAILILLMKSFGTKLAKFLPWGLNIAYKRFHEGTLGSLSHPRHVLVITGLSFIGWLLEVGRLYFVAYALGINVEFALILVAALGHAILSTIPTPGGLGAVEPGVTGILTLGMISENAISIVLVDRSISYLSILIIGGIAFLAWKLSHTRQSQRHSKLFKSKS